VVIMLVMYPPVIQTKMLKFQRTSLYNDSSILNKSYDYRLDAVLARISVHDCDLGLKFCIIYLYELLRPFWYLGHLRKVTVQVKSLAEKF